MKYKDVYEAPTAEPVEILIENCILDGSVTSAKRSSYTIDEEEDWS